MHYHEYRHEMKNPHFRAAVERISSLEEENRRLREALLRVLGWQSMLEFLAPSLAAPANLGGLIAAMKDARAALSQEQKP